MLIQVAGKLWSHKFVVMLSFKVAWFRDFQLLNSRATGSHKDVAQSFKTLGLICHNPLLSWCLVQTMLQKFAGRYIYWGRNDM